MKHSLLWTIKQWLTPKPPRSGRATPASVFAAAREKDREYYDAMPWTMTFPAFPEYWKAKYPEDFPLGGMTLVTDVSAIKPRLSVADTNDDFRNLLSEKAAQR